MPKTVLRWAGQLISASVLSIALLSACGDDDDDSSPVRDASSSGSDAGAPAGGDASISGGSGGDGAGGDAGGPTGGRRGGGTSCPPRSTAQVTCGGETCPISYPFQDNACFEPC